MKKQEQHTKNTKRNTGGVTGKGFDVLGQPTPKQKIEGWERRREKQKFMDLLAKYQGLTFEEFEEALKNMKKDKLTIGEITVLRYVSKIHNTDKFLIDWLDRLIGKAPSQNEITGAEGQPLGLSVQFTDINKDE